MEVKQRCFGNKPNQAFYAHYHDYEWGIPVYDDQRLFEMLILEGAQAGLSWETILKKRPDYRLAYHNFVVAQVAEMRDLELDGLCKNSALIRNRLKIYAARQNAQVFLSIQKEFGTFAKYLWAFVAGVPIVGVWSHFKEVPVQTDASELIAKDLKKRGMSFVGGKIIYAYMQAVGLVDDHLANCWLRL